ncbi:hypothetical protein B0A55_00636 [Friedmanniomyces simplex]|uniref:Uncharacterized protein n=1 Tax=Friedmanniomyces simplex TaxID=329884 RepID=A0A4U0Y4A7_9PEZI|nr:hypothetical protein B0A55_00636 [Friedmanniomyces simplex]
MLARSLLLWAVTAEALEYTGTTSSAYNVTNQTLSLSNSYSRATNSPSSSSDGSNTGYGAYIASGLGLTANSESSTSLAISSTSSATIEYTTSLSSATSSVSSSATGYSFSLQDAGYSSTSNASAFQSTGGLESSNTTDANQTSTYFATETVHATSIIYATHTDTASHHGAFSSPSQGVLGSGLNYGNSSGSLGSVTGATGTGPVTSKPSSLFTVPANGSGFQWDWACNHELMLYAYWRSNSFSNTTYSTTFWATNYSASTTTLCDGNNRIIGNVTPTASYQYSTQTFEYILYTGTPPSCSIPQAACSSMQMEYNSAWSVYTIEESAYTAATAAHITATAPSSATEPYYSAVYCNATGTATGPSTSCGACTLFGGSVQLLYFPTTDNSRDMCATAPATSTNCPFGGGQLANNTNAIGQATEPCAYYSTSMSLPPDTGPYIVSGGHTFFQNKAYLSYQTAYAMNLCGRVGSSYAGGIIPVASTDMYSVLGYHFELYNAAYQVNFADFNDPIPYSAFYGQPNCDEGGHLGILQWPNMLNGEIVGGLCGDPGYIVYDALYAPQLAVPPEFRALDAGWSQCLLGLDGLFDPPKALHPASSAAGPTSPVAAITSPTTTASPAQTPNSPPASTVPPTTTPTAASDDTGSSTVAPPQGGGSGSSAPSQGSGNAGGGSAPQASNNNPGTNGGGSGATPTSQGNGGSGSRSPSNDPGSANGDGASPATGDGGQSQSGSGGNQGSSADPGGAIVSAISSAALSTAAAVGGDSQDGSSGSQASSGGLGGIVVSILTSGGPSPTTGGGGGKSQGGSAGSQPSAVDPGGVVASVINGAGSSGFDPGAGPSVATVNSAAFTVAGTVNAGGSSALVIAVGGSTAILSPGQSTNVGGEVVSAGPSGAVVIGSGTGTTTVPPGDSGNVGSGTDPSVVSIGSSAFTVVPTQAGGSSAVIVGNGGSSVTLTPGSATTIGGQVVNAPSSGGVILGTGNSAVTANSASSQSLGTDSSVVATVAGAIISADPSNPNNVVVLGQTLTPGQATTISGTAVSVASGGSAVLGGSNGQPASTVPIARPTPAVLATVTANGHTLTVEQDPGSGQTLVVDGSSTATLQGSGAAVLAGVTVTAGSSGGSSYVVVGGSQTVALSSGTTAADPQAVVTLSGHAYTATELSNGDAAIDGATLSRGQAATIDGALVSVGPSGVVVGGTQTIPFESLQTLGPASQAIITLNGHIYTATELGNGDAVIDGITMTSGSTATINGVLISDGGARGLVIDRSQTVPFSAAASATASPGSEAVLTLGGSIYTASGRAGDSLVVVDGITLSRGGPAATIDGTVISDGPSGLVVGGTQTVALTNSPTTLPTTTKTSAGVQPAAVTSSKKSDASGLSAPARLAIGIGIALGVLIAGCDLGS